MTTRKVSKFLVTHAMATAAVAATVLSPPIATQAAVLMDNPAQIIPNDPATWNDATTVNIGQNNGQDASVTLDNTGETKTVNVKHTNVGNANDTIGRLTVTGIGANWNSSDFLYIGNKNNSAGFLDIRDGGSVTTHSLRAGASAGSSSTITLTNGGKIADVYSYIGDAADSTGIVMIDGKGSTWTNTNNFSVGYWGTGELTIRNGGQVNGKDSFVGDLAGSTGKATVDGEGSIWANKGSCCVGCRGTGELTIQNGGQINNTYGHIGHQAGSAGKVTVDGEGSAWVNRDALDVGYSGMGELTIQNGGQVRNTVGDIGRDADSTGKVTVDGKGSTWTNNGNLNMATYGGTAEMAVNNGGLVETYRITAGPGSASMYFDGGTIRALGSDTNFIRGNYDNLHLKQNGLTMQVDSRLTVGVSQVFSGIGGIDKTGTGTFIFNGNQAYTGLTDVKAGTLTGRASFAGTLTVRDGATYMPGGSSSADRAWTTNIAGNYTQESGATLVMDIGSKGSDMLVVGNDVSLSGILSLVVNGAVDADYYVLIDNLGSNAVDGLFSDIFVDGHWVTLTPMDGTLGGGTFMIDGSIYCISYAGDSATGSLYGGNDVILSTLGGSPNVPEPASLSLLGLGAAMLIARRRK